MIFLTAAEEMGTSPEETFVVEDAANGVEAAKAGEMVALGLARADDEELLAEAGADLVVTNLDDVSVDALSEGRLEEVGVR
jgi:beta-phosphoglucomutase-like phosphatase (HAD superfamily)